MLAKQPGPPFSLAALMIDEKDRLNQQRNRSLTL